MAGCTQINCQTQEIRKIKKKADLILKNKKGVKKVKKGVSKNKKSCEMGKII